MEIISESLENRLPQVCARTTLARMNIVAAIDRILSAKALRRKDLAALLGWSESKLSKRLDVPDSLRMGEVRRIAEALKIKAGELLEDEEGKGVELSEVEKLLLDTIREIGYLEANRRLTYVGLEPMEPFPGGRKLTVGPGRVRDLTEHRLNLERDQREAMRKRAAAIPAGSSSPRPGAADTTAEELSREQGGIDRPSDHERPKVKGRPRGGR